VIPPGSRLGPYEIGAPLGAGGMGEVYQARDTRLSRDVAIKVLASDVASDASRLKRFEKEARSASALNHPNIVTIYDIGSSDGIPWIAMERIDGQTLRKQLLSGALPTKRLLGVATQIADGLTKAHEAGIVHRDLKPENVMLTKDGVVKILDFGLAKLTLLDPEEEGASGLPTETVTSPGVLLGTVGYMSPEQAAGEPIDFRSDQFSFGSILYEMATGKRAFARKTSVDTLAAILNEEPEPIAKLNSRIPAPVSWIVERCLSKDRGSRYVSTRDLARDLAMVRDHSSEIPAGTLTPAPRRKAWPVLGALAVIAALAVAALLLLPGFRRTVPPTYRQLTFRRGFILRPRFAPDGHAVIYSASWEREPWRIYTVRPESPESSPLGLPDAGIASVSRGGELAIILDTPNSMLARAPLAGGAPRDVLDDVILADWSPDGTQLAAVHEVKGRIRLEYPIGKVLYESTGWIPAMRVSPTGDLVALSDHPEAADSLGSIIVVDREGHARTLSTGWNDLGSVAWRPDGGEVWFAGSRSGSHRSLWAVTLAGRDRLVDTAPGSLELEDVSRSGAVLLTQYSDRRYMFGLAPGDPSERSYSWLDYTEPVELSADGHTLLFEEWGEGGGSSGGIYLRRLDGSSSVRLGDGLGLALSPDGRSVLARLYANPPRLALIPTGAGQTVVLPGDGLHYEECGRFLPDGKRVVFAAREANKAARLYIQNVGWGKAVALTPEGMAATRPQCLCVSPDGERLAVLDAGGKMFVFPTRGGEPRPIPGVGPEARPLRWSADGSLYVAERWKVFRVDPVTGRRELWKEFAPLDPAGVRDDSWFVVVSSDARAYFYSFQVHLSELYVTDGLR
jgi:eukaryotic-like serine/threonine-protein kinase